MEYDSLINQLWAATIAGNLDDVFALVKKGRVFLKVLYVPVLHCLSKS